MIRNTHRVYPDSDCGYFEVLDHLPPVVDLTKLKTYKVNGDIMVKLSDLTAFDFLVSNEQEIIETERLQVASS